ncbi:MAG: DNA mismatch repair protein MutS [Bacilli bacterium]
MKRSDVDRNMLSPMMMQYMEIKDKYEDTIVFFRLGDFYEMFFEDAIVASRLLELTLTGRNCGLDERVPMCGVPFHAYEGYLEKLTAKGYKVAICEQLTPPDKKGVVERGVTQVVTKGTLMESSSLDEKTNNYIGGIYDFEHCYALSYADISTGSFFTSLIDYDKDVLVNEIIRLELKEVIVNSKISREITSTLKDNYNILVTISNDLSSGYEYIYEDIEDVRLSTSIKHLLYYVEDTKKGDLSHFKKAIIKKKSDTLNLDIHTKRNLELTETLRLKERTYSLLWLLDKTKTAMGSRLLKEMIENPLVNKKEILRRQNLISTFLVEFIYKEELRELLNSVYDLERLSGRVTYGNVNARDLLQLKKSLGVLPEIKKILASINYDKTFDSLEEVYNLLEASIKEEVPISIKEGGIIKDGFNSELDDLRSLSSGGKDFILNMEQEERERTGIKNLKVGYNRVFGYYIEISKGNASLVKEQFGYERKQTLSNSERFITPALKEKENLILNAEEKIVALEYNIFIEIKDKVKKFVPKFQLASSVLSELDVILSLSVVAEQNNFVKPEITDKRCINIKDGRHPVVEVVSKKDYISNDIVMDEKTNILLITGPNMSGKSTYMRMLAIIVILNQIGSFVPCKKAILPIFDNIFTRIGASDDLVSGESTFMVEMKEANNAVSRATKNSLILFDELGRGTATYDGMSLAQAILEYIHDKIGCKMLFSTHYHELTSLEENLRNLKNVHVSAKEEDDKIIFLHKVKSGAVDKSYGIHVASLVNLPEEIITRAREILNVYESKETKKQVYTQTSLFLDFQNQEENVIEEEIKKINPLEITPIEALNILDKLKKRVEEKDKNK